MTWNVNTFPSWDIVTICIDDRTHIPTHTYTHPYIQAYIHTYILHTHTYKLYMYTLHVNKWKLEILTQHNFTKCWSSLRYLNCTDSFCTIRAMYFNFVMFYHWRESRVESLLSIFIISVAALITWLELLPRRNLLEAFLFVGGVNPAMNSSMRGWTTGRH